MIRPASLAAAALLGLVFLAAGCGDRYGFRHHEPDAVPGTQSAAVLDTYGDCPPAAPADDLRLAADLRRGLPYSRPGRPPLETPQAAEIELAGGVERPWAEPPHTNPAAWRIAPEHSSQPLTTKGAASPAEGGLAAGVDVTVQVARHPEFSGRWEVGAEGMLTIPTGGAFGPGLLSPAEFSRRIGRAAGLTPEDLSANIARELQPYLAKPAEVTVTAGSRREGQP